MSFLHRTIGATAVAAAALIGANLPAAAGEITLSGSELGGLTYQTGSFPGDSTDASASFNGTAAVLSSGNTITLNGSSTNAQFAAAMGDAGSVFINNGTTIGGSVTSFGTLNNILAQGAAGNVSFTTSSVTGGNGPYWQVLLRDPGNAANTLLINAFGGSNSLNQGAAVNASTSLTSSGVYNNAITQSGGGAFPNNNAGATLWATIVAVLDDGTALGNWNVAALGIGDGGFNGGGQTVGDVNSISVPVSATPLPSTWTMMLAGFAGFGWLLYRRRREGAPAARFA